mgnify:CR=1 FL=1
MDSGDFMILSAILIVLVIFFIAAMLCNKESFEGMYKKVWAYNSDLEKEYKPNDVLAVISAGQNLVATRAPLNDMQPVPGLVLRENFAVEGMPYKPR